MFRVEGVRIHRNTETHRDTHRHTRVSKEGSYVMYGAYLRFRGLGFRSKTHTHTHTHT